MVFTDLPIGKYKMGETKSRKPRKILEKQVKGEEKWHQ